MIYKNNDVVYKPSHYIYSKFEIKNIEKVIVKENNFVGMESHYFCNAFEYLTRYKRKNGIEDLKKCVEYINLLIEEEEQNND